MRNGVWLKVLKHDSPILSGGYNWPHVSSRPTFLARFSPSCTVEWSGIQETCFLGKVENCLKRIWSTYHCAHVQCRQCCSWLGVFLKTSCTSYVRLKGRKQTGPSLYLLTCPNSRLECQLMRPSQWYVRNTVWFVPFLPAIVVRRKYMKRTLFIAQS